jgi:threonine/homoserine/homoserine lactone efflux protein
MCRFRSTRGPRITGKKRINLGADGLTAVMAGLVSAIHVLLSRSNEKRRDGRAFSAKMRFRPAMTVETGWSALRSRPGMAYERASQPSVSPMPTTTTLIAFALVSLGMALTPGPGMIYLISRSITQGWAAGLVSLGGLVLGFAFYMLCAALGITALMFAVPYAYDALRFAGAAYLLWLAWQAVRPGGQSPFRVKKLPVDGRQKLFAMGLVTTLLNPKIAMLYLSLLPQFIDPAANVLTQSVALGFTQIAVSVTVNAMIVMAAGSIASFLAARPIWLLLQRWLMGTVLAGLAVRMALEARR